MKQRFVTGEMILREGEESSVAYMIVSGRVEIFRELPDHSRERLAVLESGQMFGEIGVLDRAPRNASARALTDTVLRAITIEEE